jgi:hypothetical protein
LLFNSGGDYNYRPSPDNSVTMLIPGGTTYVSGYWTVSFSWGPIENVPATFFCQLGSIYGVADRVFSDPTFSVSGTATNQSGDVSVANLALINAAVGGAALPIFCYVPSSVDGAVGAVTLLTLTLVPAGTGGTAVSFTVAQQGTSSGGCVSFLVQLLDGSGNAANAGGSGQIVAYAPSGNNNIQGGTVTIGATSSTGTFTVCSRQSGMFNIQVCPGAGVLSAVACQTVTGIFTGAPTDPNAALCAITRPNIRDAIRQNLGIATPLNNGTGYAGDEPPGQKYPTNDVLNKAIGDALRFINAECNLHMQANISIAVTAASASAVGPLVIPLAGVQGCPSSLSINTIRRCRFVDTQGNITRLTPTSYWEIDKNRWSYDTVPAANPPRWYIVDGYKLFILPAPSVAGTLYLYAGTAMQNFWGDSDTIDELPSDHQLTMEWLATGFTCLMKPDEPNNTVQFQGYMKLAEPGMNNIKKFFAMMNEAHQPSLSADVGRRRRVR